MKQQFPSAAQRHGFTLIELLVVIAIIAILAAILFPVFAQARAKARQAACLSNIKQIGTGLMLYAQDYDETLPGNSAANAGSGGGTEMTSLGFMQPSAGNSANTNNIIARDVQPYIKNLQVFTCPSTQPRLDSQTFGGYTFRPDGGNTSYLFNGIALFRPLAIIPEPADTIFMNEQDITLRYSSLRPAPVPDTGASFQALTRGDYAGLFNSFNWDKYSKLHNGGANLLFCDGHAKWQRKTSIRFAQFGAKVGTGANEVNPPSRAFSEASPAQEQAEGSESFKAAF